jgi:hypothetical protein
VQFSWIFSSSREYSKRTARLILGCIEIDGSGLIGMLVTSLVLQTQSAERSLFEFAVMAN